MPQKKNNKASLWRLSPKTILFSATQTRNSELLQQKVAFQFRNLSNNAQKNFNKTLIYLVLI